MSRTMPIAGKNCSALEWLTLLIVYIVHQGVVIALGERCKNTSNLERISAIRDVFIVPAVA